MLHKQYNWTNLAPNYYWVIWVQECINGPYQANAIIQEDVFGPTFCGKQIYENGIFRRWKNT